MQPGRLFERLARTGPVEVEVLASQCPRVVMIIV